jgi:hypothetical protein
MLFAYVEHTLFVSADKDLTYHRAEIARLSAAIGSAVPNSRRAGFLRATLQLHEGIVARLENRVMRKA